MREPLEVLVVEPHPGMRASLRGVLAVEDGVHVAGEATDVLSALRVAGRVHADVAIVDDRAAALGAGGSAEGIGALARQLPVVVIGMGEPQAYTRPYLEAGASAYWCKTGEFDELVLLMRGAATAPPRAA